MIRKLLVCLVVFISAISQNLFALNFNSGGLSYQTNGNTGEVIITGVTNTSVSSVTIPPSVTYKGTVYLVNWINMDAFNKCKALKTVTVEDSDEALMSIGRTKDNNSIEEVYMGRPVCDVFSNIKSIKKVTFSDNLRSIANESLWGCTGLTEITIPGAVTQISRNAFTLCENLKSVTFLPGDNELIIHSDAFDSRYISNINLGRNVKGDYRFGDMSLDKLVIDQRVEKVSGIMFSDCKQIKELVIEDGNNVLEMSNDSFGQFVEKLYLGRNVTGAFFRMSCLKEVIIGDLVTELHDKIFDSDVNLEKITFGDGLKIVPAYCCNGCNSLLKVKLPSSVEEISMWAFYGCENLKGIELPVSLKEIGHWAFYGCLNLEEIFLPGSVEVLGSNVFSDCVSLKNVVIEDSNNALELSGSDSFGNSIEKLYLGRNVTVPFMGGSSFKEVTIGDLVTDLPERMFDGDVRLEKITFGAGLKRIPSGCCDGCTSLVETYLSSSLQEIGSRAFLGCGTLKKVEFPSSLQKIEYSAFNGCSNLTEISLPGSLEVIGDVFSNCSLLKKIVIMDSNKPLEMNRGSFGDAVENLYLGRNVTSDFMSLSQLKEVMIGDLVTELPERIFDGDAKLEKVIMGEGLKVIPASCFYRCESLIEIHLPSALQEIGYTAFYGCKSLRGIEFPSTLNRIGYHAFNGCAAISSVKILATIPPAAGNEIFDDGVYENAMLEVPKGTKTAYAAADGWKNFTNILSGNYNVSVVYDASMGKVLINGKEGNEFTVSENESVNIEILPADGYKIESVKIDGVESVDKFADGHYTVNDIEADMNVDVEFTRIMLECYVHYEPTECNVTLQVDGEPSTSAIVPYGAHWRIDISTRAYKVSVTVNGEVIPLEGSGFYCFEVEKVTEDMDVTVNCEFAVYKATVVYESDGGGVVKLNGEETDVINVTQDNPLAIEMIPDTGYHIGWLSINGVECTSEIVDKSYTIDNVISDIEVRVRFDKDIISFIAEYDATHGSVAINGNTANEVSVAYGENVIVELYPAEGWELANALLDGNDVTADFSDSGIMTIEAVKEAKHLEIFWKEKMVRLSLVGINGGRLIQIMPYNSILTYEIVCDEGWTLHSVTLGDEIIEIDEENRFTTPVLTDDMTLSVVFIRDNTGNVRSVSSSGVNVVTRNGSIFIMGAFDSSIVEIYSVDGKCIYHGSEREIPVTRGNVYLVLIEGKEFKVIP